MWRGWNYPRLFLCQRNFSSFFFALWEKVRIFAASNHIIMMRTMKKEKKLSLWERAKKMGKVLELTPGFSFDSDSQVKVYA